MTADLWSVFLNVTLALVRADIKAQGKKPAAYSIADLQRLAKAKLIQECREFLLRNGE